jgi:hypothetical protein
MWAVVPDTYNKFTAPHIQASIFNWRYLRWFWWYSDNSMRATQQSWCQIQRTASSLRTVNCGPGHIQCNYCTAYSCVNIRLNVSALPLLIDRPFNERYTANMVRNTAHILQIMLSQLCSRTYTMNLQLHIFFFNIQLNVSALLLEIYRHFNEPYTANMVPIQRITSSWRNVNCGPGHIQCNYSTSCSCVNIRLNLSALPLLIDRQFNVRYTANMVRNTAHILQIILSELWSRTYTMNLQLHIFRVLYST